MAAAETKLLELKNVSKRFGEVEALCPTSLVFESMRTYALLGTSGCGKSTLLKVALGLAPTDSGSVSVEGQVMTAANLLPLRRRIGYVIQNGGLFPHLTAVDNVTLVARFLRWPADRIEQRVAELSELVQLPVDSLQRFPAQLSGGQQQRVGLMRALLLDPDILLLDEPLGALDPIIRRDLQSDLRQIFRQLQKTVVMVTHDVHEAAYFADEIVLMRSGRVIQRGTIQDLLDSPAEPFVSEFIMAQRSELLGETS